MLLWELLLVLLLLLLPLLLLLMPLLLLFLPLPLLPLLLLPLLLLPLLVPLLRLQGDAVLLMLLLTRLGFHLPAGAARPCHRYVFVGVD